MRIGFLFAGGRVQRMLGAECGNAPTDFMHGCIELKKKGHDIGVHELQAGKSSKIITVTGNLLNRFNVLPHKVDGTILQQVFNVVNELSKYDVVVVAGSPVIFALAIWQQLGFMNTPMVGINCGLFNFEYKYLQKKITIGLLRRMETVLFGDGELQPLVEMVGNGSERIAVNQFGVDIVFWTPEDRIEEPYFLSVGMCGRRDYELLMKVAAEMPEQKFKVLARLPGDIQVPVNVEVTGGDYYNYSVTDEGLRDLYRRSTGVIVPIKQTYQPSGQSVCLQAMACGKTVILTNTNGLWSSRMQNGSNIVLVPPNDPEAMKQAVIKVRSDAGLRRSIGKAARETICDYGTMEKYADGIEAACIRALNYNRRNS